MKMQILRKGTRVTLMVLVVSMSAATAWSQSTDKPPASTASSSSATTSSATTVGASADNSADRPQHVPDYTGVSAGDRFSGLLLGEQSPLHWGHLNVLSFSFMQSYQNNTEATYNDSILRGDLNYSISKADTDLAIGYSPSVWFSQNGVQSNLSDHHLDFATHHKWGRWVIGATDNFYSLPLQSQFSQFGFIDPGYYGRNMDPSLIAGDVLSNQAQFAVDRLLSPSDRIQFTLGYLYYQISGARFAQLSTPNSTQNTADAGISWNHQLNWRSSFNVAYRYARSYYDVTSGFSQHHSIVGTYSLEPKHGWQVAMSFGPTYVKGQLQNPETTYLANVAVTKRFRRSSVSVMGGRTDEFVGLIGDTITNMAGVTFNYEPTRKLQFTGGGNYIREVAGISSHSWRAWDQASYSLTRGWSLTLGYSYFQQSISTPVNQLPSHFVTAGIRWSWSPERR